MPQIQKKHPDLKILADSKLFLSLLMEATEQDLPTVKRRLAEEEACIGTNVANALKQWGIAPSRWDDRLEAFYEQTDAFLFETLTWNRTPAKQKLRDWIADFLAKDQKSGAQVLTYGDGLGFDGVFLARCGYTVTYFEKSNRCAAFCAQMAAREGVPIRHVADPKAIGEKSFDVVTCLDVLEHVPQPARLVADLVKYLKPGGRLIVHAPFWYVHSTAATHLEENRKYSGTLSELYVKNGLRLIGGNARWSPLVFEKLAPGVSKTPVLFKTRLALTAGKIIYSVARFWSWPLFRLSGL